MPTEICQLCEGGRPNDDLKAISLVSRTFREIAAKSLFQRIVIPLDSYVKEGTVGYCARMLLYLNSTEGLRYRAQR